MSKIKTFEEYQVEVGQLFEITDAYNAGVAEATAFYEEEPKLAKEVIKRIEPSKEEIQALNESSESQEGSDDN